jgi:hypothetical protein
MIGVVRTTCRRHRRYRCQDLGHLSDESIEAMLNELSIELGAALGQERIYVAFADRTRILDAGERRKTSPDLSI